MTVSAIELLLLLLSLLKFIMRRWTRALKPEPLKQYTGKEKQNNYIQWKKTKKTNSPVWSNIIWYGQKLKKKIKYTKK